MMRIIILCFSIMTFVNVQGQELINGTYDFQGDPNKKYTLYIPSTYESDTPNDLMLGLHPFNTSRWDAESWCDTLKTFAEANNLLLVCPDGGQDGKVDDAIDTAFTTFLIDEVISQYTIDEESIYAIGFSWGGKTVYTYGLQHADRFAGFIPVGAAVNSSEVTPLLADVSDKKFYVVHGSNDSPNIRFTPIVSMLDPLHCVETNLLSGVGHTIDFPNRNQILTDALNWIKTHEGCSSTVNTTNIIKSEVQFLKYNTLAPGQRLPIRAEYANDVFTIYNFQGVLLKEGTAKNLKLNAPGQYILSSKNGESQKFIISQ